MKYYSTVLLLLFLPTLALASSVLRTAETVTVSKDQVVEGDFYGAGNYVDITGEVKGDLLLAGGEVVIAGSILDDVSIIGGTVNLSGQYEDDVRVFAGSVVVSGVIKGDLMVIGNNLKISSTAEIGGDVIYFGFFGGTAEVNGLVGGDLLGGSSIMRVDGTVLRGIDVKTQSLTLGERAVVGEDVRYQSAQEIIRAAGASVQGVVTRSDAPVVATTSWREAVIILLITLFAVLVVYLLLPAYVKEVTAQVESRPLRSVLIGFAILFFLPMASIILMISTLGFVLGVLLLFVYGALILVAMTMVGITVGSYISTLFKSKVTNSVSFVVLGVAVVHLILFIPIIGQALVWAVFLLTLGAVSENLYKRMRAG